MVTIVGAIIVIIAENGIRIIMFVFVTKMLYFVLNKIK
jgi:hypothetical protein